MTWRVCIVLAGFVYSVLLFRQQYLQVEASQHDQREAISSAVNKANEHTDSRISKLNDNLREKLESVADQVSKSETTLSKGIREVVVPPQKFADIVFSLEVKTIDQFPRTTQSIPANADGSFTVKFIARNPSNDVPTGAGDLWVIICRDCTYAKEPSGFEKPAGSDEHSRHKKFPSLNPGVFLEVLAIDIVAPVNSSAFQVALRYACERCKRKDDWQSLTITKLPATPIPQ